MHERCLLLAHPSFCLAYLDDLAHTLVSDADELVFVICRSDTSLRMIPSPSRYDFDCWDDVGRETHPPFQTYQNFKLSTATGDHNYIKGNAKVSIFGEFTSVH